MKTNIFKIILFLLLCEFTLQGCSQDTTVNSGSNPAIVKMKGLAFSPYMTSQSPDIGTQISEEQIRNLLNKVNPYTEGIRTFGSTDGLEKIPSIAKALGLKVAAGAWLSDDLAKNEIQINNLITAGQNGHVDIAIVGSEVLLRGDLTKAQLINYINRVKAALPDVKVTTADVYQKFLENSDLVSAVNILLPNIYPFWEGISVDCSPYFINTIYNSLLEISNGKEVIIGETGWPSGGNTVGNAIPSSSNSEKYFINFVSWAKARNTDYFYFEAFDEEWKAALEGPQGAHWGIFYKNGGVLKPGMNRVFAGETVSNNWYIDTTVTLSDTPSVVFTYVPPSDNSFETDITTGGNDPSATRIRAYALADNYDPPLVSGGSIPSSLQNEALAWTEIIR